MEKVLACLERRLSSFSDLHKYSDLSLNEIMSLVKECTANPWFECEFGVYIQTVGAPMGGPMSCILADLFMEDYEEQIKFQMGSREIDIDWLRYRDDTWFMWQYSLDELHNFLNYLNSLDNHIQWTFEIEKERSISFLDVWVTRNLDGSFTTSVYRKPTHSDRYLHFSSDHPLQQKLSAIHTLKLRANTYCSNHDLLEKELSHLRRTFVENGYPEEIVVNILYGHSNSAGVLVDLSDDNPEKVGCLVIPFVPEIHRKVRSLCDSLGVHLLYSRKPNLGNLLAPIRPSLSVDDTRNCVYQIPCGDCDSVYIGETKRKFSTRCKEHKYACMKASSCGAVKESEKYDTGLPLHSLEFQHNFNFHEALILKRELNHSRRKFLEAIEILKKPNSINLNAGKRIDVNWRHVILLSAMQDTDINPP
jgi:hypothetical protein